MARINVDEWGAEAPDRIERRGGRLGEVEAAVRRLPPSARGAVVVGLLALLPALAHSGYIVQVGVSGLLMAILAVGLNVTAGWAGLLDLGYVAFYGFGAYTYALLSSPQIHVELPGIVVLLVVLVASALLGAVVGLPSIRLVGDYLAIVTLFFGEAFVQVVTNVAPNVLGGPGGIPGANQLDLLGLHLMSVNVEYWFLLGFGALAGALLFNLNRSRLGRGWRALRENSLAAEVMGVPVNRMKLLAFTIGATIAGLTGTVFASVEYGAYPTSFDSELLIMVYAAVVLGGTGSLPGVVIGAAVVVVLPEILRSPSSADYLFYLLVLVAILGWLRPWRRPAAVLSGVLAAGFATRALVAGAWPRTLAGSPFLGDFGKWWMVTLKDPTGGGDVGFIALVAGFVLVLQARGRLRDALLALLVYLAAFVWQNLLVYQPAITRELMLGVLLIAAMNLRPQGLLGEARVEVV